MIFFVRFLEEFEDSKKFFWNELTFSYLQPVQTSPNLRFCFIERAQTQDFMLRTLVRITQGFVSVSQSHAWNSRHLCRLCVRTLWSKWNYDDESSARLRLMATILGYKGKKKLYKLSIQVNPLLKEKYLS